MQSLYIVEQGAKVEKEGELLAVKAAGMAPARVPLATIERVIACGNIQFTTQSLGALALRGVTVSFLSYRGSFKYALVSPLGKNIERRVRQYALCADPEYRREFARAVVRAKIHNGHELISRHGRRRGMERLNEFRVTVDKLLEKVETAADVDALRGLEGFAARVYFFMLGKAFPRPFGFHGRSKRPPLDPVNALLSLGYTLLAGEISSLLEAYGCDPFMGFYHAPEYGRSSLALDLCEEFRAVAVDRMALYLVKQGVFKPGDFEPEKGGCYLVKEGLKRFYVEYEKWMRRDLGFKEPACMRDLLRRQVERMVKAVDASVPYYPLEYGENDVYCGEL